MKTVPMETKRAVPSIFTVAPIGNTNLEILGSTPHLSFMHRNVIGKVAALRTRSLLAKFSVWLKGLRAYGKLRRTLGSGT